MPKDASPSPAKKEVEIKLRLGSSAEGRRLLRKAGFRVEKRRVLERNVLFDTPGKALRQRGLVLRLRISGAHSLVTFKGPAERGKHKIRQEIEFELERGGGPRLVQVLEALGYRPAFRYEKYRTEYVLPTGSGLAASAVAHSGIAMLDETPVGVFLELEGPPRWIDRTARLLGFHEADYITASYAELHRSAGGGSRDMLF
ncbi:MAG TPA: class IV adenylate cyclase [Bryobacteraceae bacterium]|nr:class IV adenylate cyclase [Bryobacteraceae bacterium]